MNINKNIFFLGVIFCFMQAPGDQTQEDVRVYQIEDHLINTLTIRKDNHQHDPDEPDHPEYGPKYFYRHHTLISFRFSQMGVEGQITISPAMPLTVHDIREHTDIRDLVESIKNLVLERLEVVGFGIIEIGVVALPESTHFGKTPYNHEFNASASIHAEGRGMQRTPHTFSKTVDIILGDVMDYAMRRTRFEHASVPVKVEVSGSKGLEIVRYDAHREQHYARLEAEGHPTSYVEFIKRRDGAHASFGLRPCAPAEHHKEPIHFSFGSLDKKTKVPEGINQIIVDALDNIKNGKYDRYEQIPLPPGFAVLDCDKTELSLFSNHWSSTVSGGMVDEKIRRFVVDNVFPRLAIASQG